MKRKPIMITFLNVILLAILLQFNNCSVYRGRDGKTSTLGNPMREKTAFAFSQYQQVEGLSVCIQDLSLTDANGNTVTVPYASHSEIHVPVTGIDLETLPVPNAQYTKIELKVADVCGTSHSVSVTNDSGSFSTAMPLSIHFAGNEFVGNTQQKIVLDVAELAKSLSQAMSNANVASLASGAFGLYRSLSCGMQTSAGPVAMCERFERAATVTGRSGQLDSSLWTVSRLGVSNQGQNMFNQSSESTLDACGTLQTAVPGVSDLVVCNGQLRESQNDMDYITALSFTANQAFDFNGRTGTVAFDVTNDTSGTTGVYPEVYLTERPLLVSEDYYGFKGFPKNGISLRFAGNYGPQVGAQAPGCPNDDNNRWILDQVTIFSNYTAKAMQLGDNDPQFVTFGCAISSSGPNGAMNHIELRVAQDQVEVWATDAGSAGLKKIAFIKNTAFSFTRGYLSFGDYHAHAGSGPRPETKNHTFAWDNIAFDGPFIARDLNFDVPDAMDAVGSGLYNLGYNSSPGTPAQLNSLPMTSQQVAAAVASGKNAILAINFTSSFTHASSFNYTVNGVPLNTVVPFTTITNDIHSVELPIPASALVAGPQVISISGDQTAVIFNATVRVPGS